MATLKEIKDYILENKEPIVENTSVTFDGKTFPRFGQAIYMAGGPNSSKSTFINNQLLVDAKVMDTDNISRLYIALVRKIVNDPDVDEKVKDSYLFPFDGKVPDFSDPDDVELIHNYTTKDKQFFNSYMKNILRNTKKNLQNIVIDTTGINIDKTIDTVSLLKQLSYETTLVWVITDINTAIYRNSHRSRKVNVDYLVDVHKRILHEFPEAITNGEFKDFDNIWIAFSYNIDESKPHKEKYKDTVFPLKKNSDGTFNLEAKVLMQIIKVISCSECGE